MPTKEAETYINEIQMRLQSLKREFLDLELEQMRKGEISARQKIERAKRDITPKRKQLEEQLSQAREAPASSWEETREGVESAWTDLRGAVDAAREDFYEEESRAGDEADEEARRR